MNEGKNKKQDNESPLVMMQGVDENGKECTFFGYYEEKKTIQENDEEIKEMAKFFVKNKKH